MPLIEFCGLPGSGKSTINRLLVERLRTQGAQVVDRRLADEQIETRYVGAAPLSTGAEALKFGLCRPRWGGAALGVLRRSHSRRTIRSVIRIQNQLRLSLALGKTHQLVVDEWVIHEAWLATAESPRVRMADVQRLLGGVSSRLENVPRLLVRLTANPTVAAARVASRPQKTWFQQVPTSELVRMLEEANVSLDALCHTSCQGGTRSITMDTTEKCPASIVDELLPQLKDFT